MKEDNMYMNLKILFNQEFITESIPKEVVEELINYLIDLDVSLTSLNVDNLIINELQNLHELDNVEDLFYLGNDIEQEGFGYYI